MQDNCTIKKKIICKDTGEIVYCYTEYLQTAHWRNLRKLIAIMADYKCEACGKYIKKGYNIHHLTYKRLGNEWTEDLLFLCPNCHNTIHANKKTKKKIKTLPNNSLYEKIKKERQIKKQIKIILSADKDIKQMFLKHFKLFMKELKEYEKEKL